MVLLREQPLPTPTCPYFRSDGSERQLEQDSIAKKLAFIDSKVAAGQSIGDGYVIPKYLISGVITFLIGFVGFCFSLQKRFQS